MYKNKTCRIFIAFRQSIRNIPFVFSTLIFHSQKSLENQRKYVYL